MTKLIIQLFHSIKEELRKKYEINNVITEQHGYRRM